MPTSPGRTRASREPDPAGDFIPGAVESVASVGVAVQHPSGWFGGARFRHFGEAPLIEDDSVRSDPTTVVNFEVGPALRQAVLGLAGRLQRLRFGRQRHHIFLREPAVGRGAPVEDRHFHPVEPRTLRLTVETRF